MANVKINVDQSQLNTAIDKLNKITEKLKESTKVKKINIDSSGISKISIDVKKLGSSLNGINSKLSTLKNTLLAYFSISAIKGFANQIDEGAKKSLEFSQIQDRLKQSLATTGRLKFYDQILKQQDEVRKSSTFTRTQLIEAANSATQVKGVGFNKLLQLGRDAGAYRKINPNQVIEELGGIENKDQVRDFVKKYGNIDKLTENSLKLLFDPTLRGYGARRAAANLTLESIGGTDKRQRKENEGFYQIQNSTEDFSQKIDSLKLKLENVLGPTIKKIFDDVSNYIDSSKFKQFITTLPEKLSKGWDYFKTTVLPLLEKLSKLLLEIGTFVVDHYKLVIAFWGAWKVAQVTSDIVTLISKLKEMNLLISSTRAGLAGLAVAGTVIGINVLTNLYKEKANKKYLESISSGSNSISEITTQKDYDEQTDRLKINNDRFKSTFNSLSAKEKEDLIRYGYDVNNPLSENSIQALRTLENESFSFNYITREAKVIKPLSSGFISLKNTTGQQNNLAKNIANSSFTPSTPPPPSPPPPPIKETNQKGYSGGLDVNNIQQVRKTEIHIGVINGINGGNFGILDISNKEAVKNFANYVGKTLAETVENGGVGSVQVAPQ